MISPDNLVLVWYDIETTTTQRIQFNTERFTMDPYLICADVELTVEHADLNKYSNSYIFTGETCAV